MRNLRATVYAAVLLVVVCFVSLMIQLYSGAFMQDDSRFAWYYAVLICLRLDCSAWSVAPNFIELNVVLRTLEVLCSYLLIAALFREPSAAKAARRLFIVTRLGDAALFVGIIMFWRETEDDETSRALTAAAQGRLIERLAVHDRGGAGLRRGHRQERPVPAARVAPGRDGGPDAGVRPDPRGTMVAAGVYSGRADLRHLRAEPDRDAGGRVHRRVHGAHGGDDGADQEGHKRVIAYSTVSQLGYMMLALGSGLTRRNLPPLQPRLLQGAPVPGAGSIIYAMNSYNIFDMGGLRRRMPVTFWTMVIAGSRSRIFPLSGSGRRTPS
jgi:NADH-quinone oxidoreductase subunit L